MITTLRRIETLNPDTGLWEFAGFAKVTSPPSQPDLVLHEIEAYLQTRRDLLVRGPHYRDARFDQERERLDVMIEGLRRVQGESCLNSEATAA